MKSLKELKKRIYLDNASITRVAPEVLKEMMKYSGVEFANPSSIHAEGVAAKKALGNARKGIADALHGHADEIVFTGSGTEANNLAIIGAFEARMDDLKKRGKGIPADLHFITSAIEHPSVLEVAGWLSTKGVKVDYISVDNNGIISTKELKEKIRPNTFMVSIMFVNNEIGTVQPIDEIAKIVRAARKNNAKKNIKDDEPVSYPYLHVDASQAPEYLPLDVRGFGADLITLDGQKMYGPRGIGMLWARRGTKLEPIIRGGGQEQGLRSGTENLASICGFAKAIEIALDSKRQQKEAQRVTELRDYFIVGLQSDEMKKAGISMNGGVGERIANNVNISVKGIDTEFLLLQLDACGIACSTKSSCLTDEDESYVIKALGKGKEAAVHSLRFSLGRQTNKEDIDTVLAALRSFLSIL